MSRHSASFYVCAAFLAIFGFMGLTSVDPGSAKVELGLAVLVLAAGLYLHSGAEQGRLVGMVALAVVIAYGVWQLTQGQYVPGTIVAGLAMIRLASAGSPTPAPVGYPQTYPPGSPPQQMYYGRQPLGAPAPYGAPSAGPAQPQQPYDPYAPPPGR